MCYYALKFNIYKHQKLSLYIISFFLLVIIIIEFYISINIPYKIFALFFCCISCLFRSFLDVTEKYLFDYNYINILSMLIYEGLIGIFLFIIFFIVNKSYQTEGRNILIDMSHFNWQLITFILLIILYTVISGFRNAYRVTTNKYYSPMSRALFESTLDPFLFIYNFFVYEKKEENWIYFGSILFCLTVISISTFIYNELIVLYCCGLEYNTYYEINKRLYFRKQSSSINDNIDNILYEEENNEDNESDKDDYGKDNKTELKSTLEKEQSLIFESF